MLGFLGMSLAGFAPRLLAFWIAGHSLWGLWTIGGECHTQPGFGAASQVGAYNGGQQSVCYFWLWLMAFRAERSWGVKLAGVALRCLAFWIAGHSRWSLWIFAGEDHAQLGFAEGSHAGANSSEQRSVSSDLHWLQKGDDQKGTGSWFLTFCHIFAILWSLVFSAYSGCQVSLRSCLDWPGAGVTKKALPGHRWSAMHCRGGFRWLLWILLWGGLGRIGGAAHPGPNMEQTTWTFGIANPSGLNSKVDQVAHQDGQAWVFSETQLSKQGFSMFKKGMGCLQTKWKYLVPGAPCPVRKHGQAGTHSGVLLVSQFPSRALPNGFDPDSFATGRFQVAGMMVGGSWITIGMLYGVPCNATHQFARYQTETYLAELVERVGFQATGPRIICGDFNYATHELSQLQRLHECGFREAQDLWAWRHGVSVSSTGRGAKRIDQIWLSPELQGVLQRVEVCWDKWADHATVETTFLQQGMDQVSQVWAQPMPFPWPQQWTCHLDFDGRDDPTMAYAKVWSQLESGAKCIQAQRGCFVSRAQCGRAQTLAPRRSTVQGAPIKSARQGEIQPSFFGISLQHARFFKQLRRLQALTQLLAKGLDTWHARANAQDTWRAIRTAVGFPGGFVVWWEQHGLGLGLAAPATPELPYFLPSYEFVLRMFEGFHSFVKQYEAQLAQKRYHYGKQRRMADMNVVFQDCKAEPPPVVDTLIDRVEVGIEEVRPEDCSLVLCRPTVLLPGLPVVVQGHAREVIAHEHDQVWLESVDGLEAGQVMTQEHVVMTDEAILQRFKQAWEPRWNKHAHVVPGQWDQICGFMERVLPCVQWPQFSWTPELFAELVNQKRVRAAKGPDGVSQPDLASLPQAGQQAMVGVYEAVEGGAFWPSQVACGFVASLAKSANAQTVDEYRPVTVYSLLYRVWSSARAKEALQVLSGLVPQSVQGGLPARQARSVWYSTAQFLESALIDRLPLHGILMDIRKCFNAIPRYPLWCALRVLGFPTGVLRAWVAFVSGQTRRFKARRSTGEPIASVCGLPEGCALSVFGMVIIDWVLDLWLQAAQPGIGLHAFIDDWGVLFPFQEQFHGVWQAVLDFTTALDLELDFHKTKVWSTQTTARQAFRQQSLQVTLAARNLGAHQNFSRHSWNSNLRARLEAMPLVWVKLRASLSPYRTKLHAVRMLAWPKALHGISVVHLGASHYKQLRTGVMRAIQAERKGANPVLHLATTKLETDPEAWTVLQTLRDARELGGFEKVDAMLALFAAKDSDMDLPSNGPTAVLMARLNRLGWAVATNGLVQDRYGVFSLTQLGWDELALRVRLSWGHVLGSEVAHRDSFQGIEMADLQAVQSMLERFGTADQVYLRCHLDGTLYTQNGRAHFQADADGLCPWCGHKDGFYHRAWNCPFFADCRTHLDQRQLALIPLLPRCLSCHGWAVILPEWELFANWLVRDHGFSCLSPLSQSQSELSHKVDLFVDGTAANPREPRLRYAAWAITLAETGSRNSHVLMGGHVQGLCQTPFRAELTAVFYALRWAKERGVSVRIWTDCLGVLRGLKKVMNGRPVRINRAHSDLWLKIQGLFEDWSADQVQLIKVVSHCSLNEATSPLEDWAFWHNALVDQAAAHINETREAVFWELWRGLAAALTQHRQLHQAILLVLLQSGRKAHLAEQQQGKVPQPAPRAGPQSLAPMPVAPSSWEFQDNMVRRYGEVNARMIHSWWHQVGTAYLEGSAPLEMISGLQLFWDFFQTTQYFGPWVYRKRWYDQEQNVPELGRLPWGHRIKAFLLMWKHYLGCHHVKIPQKLTRPKAVSISHWVVCYRLRMPPEKLAACDAAVFAQLHRQAACAADIQLITPATTG